MSTPEDIEKRVAAMEAHHQVLEHHRQTSQYNMVVRLAIELAASVGVGIAIGYYIDEWLGTSPIFLLICLLFGSAAGFVTIRRVNDAYIEEMEKREEIEQEILDK